MKKLITGKLTKRLVLTMSSLMFGLLTASSVFAAIQYGPKLGSNGYCYSWASFNDRGGSIHYSLNIAGAAVSSDEKLMVGSFIQSVACLYSQSEGAAWFGASHTEGRMLFARSFETNAEFIIPIVELKQEGIYGRGLAHMTLPISEIVKAKKLQKMRNGDDINMIVRLFEAYPKSKSVIGSLNPDDYILSRGYGQIEVELKQDADKQNLPYKFTRSSLYEDMFRP